jgi:hypothetical protein
VGRRMHPKPSAEMGRPGIFGNEQYRMTGSLPVSASHRHLSSALVAAPARPLLQPFCGKLTAKP